MRQKCKDCYYYLEWGRCCRFLPNQPEICHSDHTVTGFPVVGRDDGCGEWAPTDEAEMERIEAYLRDSYLKVPTTKFVPLSLNLADRIGWRLQERFINLGYEVSMLRVSLNGFELKVRKREV